MSTEFSDAQLVRYLDGTMAPDEAQRIESALESSAALAERVAELQVDTDALAGAFADFGQNAPRVSALDDHHVAMEVQLPASRRNQWLALAATAVVALVIGAVVARAWWLENAPPATLADWHADVITYHKLYVPDTLAPLQADEAARNRQLAKVGAALAVQLDQSLGALPGVQFKRAQLLGFEGTPLAHLSYQSASGTPIAICVMRTPDSPDSKFVLHHWEGLRAVTWTRNATGYIVVGAADASVLEALASATAAAI